MKTLANFLRLKIILPFFIFWLFTTIVLLVVYTISVLKIENEKNSLILNTANESLRSPISLGSFVEIKSRLYNLNKKYDSHCLDYISQDFYTNYCEHFTNRKFVSVSNFNDSFGGINYSIKMYKSSLKFIKNTMTYLGFICFSMLLAGFWFFKQINSVAKRINNEINSIFSRDESSKKYLITEFSQIEKDYKNFTQMQNDHIESEAKTNLAKQVSHDIRSPLSALSLILDDIELIPFDRKFLLRSAIERIQDISNNLLLNKDKSNDLSNSTHMLSSLIEMIISEKRIEYRNQIHVTIGLDLEKSYGLFSQINSNELKTILSNLINNAIEACDKNDASVIIELLSIGNENIIQVKDNGAGISSQKITLLGNESFTDKVNGHGLGLFNAKKALTQYGGKLSFTSEINNGTTVAIHLPKASPPTWFVKEINLKLLDKVICIDDDKSILEMWKQKIKNLEILKFHTSFDDVEICKINSCLYLIDYEILNSKINGIDFIINNQLQKNSILVTSRFEEENVQTNVIKNNLLMLPKNILRQVPIKNDENNFLNTTDILIDNDELVRLTWHASAKKHNRILLSFSSFNEVNLLINKIDRDVNIYIDEELDNNVHGQDLAEDLHKLGFNNIFMTSGHSKDYFNDLKFLKAIIDKKPPFSS